MKNKFLLLSAAAVLMAGCASDPLVDEMDAPAQNGPQQTRFIHINTVNQATELLVKFKEQYSRTVETSVAAARSRGQMSRSGLGSFDDFLNRTAAISFERAFPGGKFEKRTRESGLHLWYKVRFESSLTAEELKEHLLRVPEVSAVEFMTPLRLVDGEERTPEQYDDLPAMGSRSLPVNDPGMAKQWHYHNAGNVTPHAVQGADINLASAWERTMGDPSVVVAVVDEMVQYKHPDLKDNMWVNTAEANGQPGVDDDNNGYVDDVYGYNFVSKRGDGEVGLHGTHVAGTIAAVNNNNIGVAGVAGGSGHKDGARIMTCGIFSGDESNNPLILAHAVKYAADNGAVILQNSWGYEIPNISWDDEEFFSVERQAMDYFIKYAGIDLDGETTGPMEGGVIIFAAGNSGYLLGNRVMWPAAHSDFISVSATGCDNRPAYYTCYGPWVDIIAPGGDQTFDTLHGGVYSTIIGQTPDDYTYGFLQGTSMACPHVSGVAALVVSYAKEKNYPLTNRELKDILLSSGRDIEDYFTGMKELKQEGAQYPLLRLNLEDYKGQMGNGLIDASLALDRLEQLMGVPSDHVLPSPVETVEVSESESSGVVSMKWKLTADCKNNPLQSYSIYYSSEEIEVKAGKVVQDKNTQGPVVVHVKEGARVGDWMETSLAGLKNNTDYHFAIVGQDQWRTSSTPVLFTGSTMAVASVVPLKNMKVLSTTSHSLILQWEEAFDANNEPYLSYQIGYYTGERHPYIIQYVSVHALGEEGVPFVGELDGLMPNTQYHLEIVAFDKSGNPSEMVTAEATTIHKIMPLFQLPIVVQYWEKGDFEFRINDPDFSTTKLSLLTEKEGWTLSRYESDKFHLLFNGPVSFEGEDSLVVKVDDDYLGTFNIGVKYSVVGNVPPVLLQHIPDQYVENQNGKLVMNLNEYFKDENGEPLKYDVDYEGDRIVTRLDKDVLEIDAAKNGLTEVTVRATDGRNESVQTTFKVMARISDRVMDLYPNPVKDVMYVRFGKDVSGPIKVKVLAYNGTVLRETTGEVSPYEPAKIDMKGIHPGQLMIHVEYKGQTYKGNVIKL